MKKKFTTNYIKENVLHEYKQHECAHSTCNIIQDEYPKFLKEYKEMLKKQFDLTSNEKCLLDLPNADLEDITLLRVLLLQSFEEAILKKEINLYYLT